MGGYLFQGTGRCEHGWLMIWACLVACAIRPYIPQIFVFLFAGIYIVIKLYNEHKYTQEQFPGKHERFKT